MTQTEFPFAVSLTDKERTEMWDEFYGSPELKENTLWDSLEESLVYLNRSVDGLPLLDRHELHGACEGLLSELEFVDDVVHRLKNMIK